MEEYAERDLKIRISGSVFRIHKKKGDVYSMQKGIRICFFMLNILIFLASLLCLLQTNRNNERINEIFPSFYYIEDSTASVCLPSGENVNLLFRENNVEIAESYNCKSIEDCYAVVFTIKAYAREHGIEIYRPNTDMVGELRLHNLLYKSGYKQNETGDTDMEYICDRRWYVNVASRMIGWMGI